MSARARISRDNPTASVITIADAGCVAGTHTRLQWGRRVRTHVRLDAVPTCSPAGEHHPHRCLLLHGRDGVRVGVEGNRHRRVPEALRDDLGSPAVKRLAGTEASVPHRDAAFGIHIHGSLTTGGHKALPDDLRMDAGVQRQGGVRVPEVVQPSLREGHNLRVPSRRRWRATPVRAGAPDFDSRCCRDADETLHHRSSTLSTPRNPVRSETWMVQHNCVWTATGRTAI